MYIARFVEDIEDTVQLEVGTEVLVGDTECSVVGIDYPVL